MKTLTLLNIAQSLETYKSLHAKNPSFGMDMYDEEFEPYGFVILQNNGGGRKGIPIRCSHYTLILTLSGGSFRHVNQFTYEIKSHSLHLLVPGSIHSFEDTSDDSQSFVILFDEEYLSLDEKNLLAFHKEHLQFVDLQGILFKRILDIYEQLNLEYKNKKSHYKEIGQTLLTQILYLLKREKLSKPRIEFQNRAEQITSEFLCLIEEHFYNLKSVQEYADILELTPKHLSETIKKTLDTSVLFLIHQRVMKELQYLLSYTSMSIKQIISILSFENSSDLGRFFKRYEGVSPKVYRMQNTLGKEIG
ncbi:AraC family transcriptional regulator [Sulfurimonas sp.]|jgi:AraC family transcriptional regulator, transcriptional activator of pobA|uniref:AraC family transcriptional regulator n=1 Tax=Sulfurimonas sp. TaxID=2022749 RepID=UPI0025D05722|nr:AraC family transcriptional regulator [Sulfurimonas sp.]MBT5933940.1 helix-turn-helix domain-containing protein [Sulfurimonas sp.]